MRKILKLALFLSLVLGFVACGENGDKAAAEATSNEQSQTEMKTLKVGATPVPAAEILEFVKPQMLEKGIDMQIQTFTDYVVPDVSLAEGSSDANMYQHKPFMDNMNEQKGYKLVALAPIYVVPLGFYSHKFKSIDELGEGANIAIPGDSSNMARAFILLHDNGVIKLKDPSNLNATELDIVENPKGIIFKPLEAASLPMVLDSVDGAVINANYALQAKMSIKDALFHENDKSAYVNVLVAREDNQNDERIGALKDALLSEETRDFILSKYKGEIIPATKE
ncbi:MAG: ABC transporter substrate-binding protein [Helicobacter sp.]|uniref:MetQ/NlpA family ABC transporter substrate-binding protein n=1 Tax=Helicobacter sp. TaxID=218 RepID=UPI0025BD8358|nr:MetQ/NlpA family ABC transporter substrate-binding protein [Helicobacter sp.]MCH5314030.1 ABC transporter substrate-binding protein [Helicobacter sp.]